MRTSTRSQMISIGLILIITFTAFLPSLKNGFTNWDDHLYVTGNPRIKALNWENVKCIFTSLHHGFYKPLTEFSFAIEHHFFGLNPRVYHTTNLLFHLLNCLLVFWLIFLLSRRLEVSFITALLFGIHPLHVESVAWITERKDVLYASFLLGSLISYIFYRRDRAIKFYYFSLLLFLLSLLPKPQGVLFPFLLLLLDYFGGRRLDRKALGEKVPFLLISLVFTIIAVVGQPAIWGLGREQLFPRLGTAVYGLFFYLVKTALPVKLSCLYPYPDKTGGMTPPLFLFSPFILAAATIGVIFSGRYTRKFVFAALFFLINVLPVSQVIRTGPAATADRYTYIPSIGLFYVAGECLRWLQQKEIKCARIAKSFFLSFLIVTIFLLSFLTRRRCQVWKDGRALWSDVLKKHANVPVVHNNLGNALNEEGNFEEAIFHYNEALRLKPDYADAYYNKGVALAGRGRTAEAIFSYQQALRFDPDYSDAHNNLGIHFVREGDFDQAVFHYNEALRIKPDDFEVHFNLGKALLKQGKAQEAIKHFEAARKLSPGLEPVEQALSVLRNLGNRRKN